MEGSVFSAGATVQWLRDGLGIIETSAESERLASEVADSDGVYLVPAFSELRAPYWDMYERGVIVGLTRGSTASHVARAALESIAYQTRDILGAMRQDTGAPLTSLRVDGGATDSRLPMQFQSDLLGLQVLRSAVRETNALGAGFLAGLGVGFWDSPSDVKSLWRADETFVPAMEDDRRESLYGEWRWAVDRSRGWAS